MKINKTVLLAASALLVFTASCEKSEKNPAPYDVGIDNIPSGAFLRTLEVTSDEIDFGDIAGASFGVNLEHNDADNGNLLVDVNVYLSIIDNSMPAAEFSVDCVVEYIDDTNLDGKSSTRTWNKKITVYVSSPSMYGQDENKPDTVKMSAIHGHWYFR